MTIAEDRYRMLLGASTALADQPTVKAVLQSLRGVLSSISRLHGADLYGLSEDGSSLRLLDFDKEVDAPVIQIGTKIPCVGAVAEVIHEQKPVLLPDLAEEMSKHPELASYAPAVCRSKHIFVSRIYRAQTIRNTCINQGSGTGISSGRCEADAIDGFARCHCAGVRIGKGSGGAVST